MVLPATGNSISMAQIRDEFGGSNPASLSQYYRGSERTSFVPNITMNNAISQSGQISMGQFRGTAAFYGIPAFLASGTTFTPNPCVAGLEIQSNGTALVYYSQSGFGQNVVEQFGPWVRTASNSTSLYEVRVTVNSGFLTTGTTGTWLGLGSFRSWTVETSGSFTEFRSAGLTVDFRLASVPGTIIYSVTGTLTAVTEQGFGGGGGEFIP
jgi:hypothetical protein